MITDLEAEGRGYQVLLRSLSALIIRRKIVKWIEWTVQKEKSFKIIQSNIILDSYIIVIANTERKYMLFIQQAPAKLYQ